MKVKVGATFTNESYKLTETLVEKIGDFGIKISLQSDYANVYATHIGHKWLEFPWGPGGELTSNILDGDRLCPCGKACSNENELKKRLLMWRGLLSL